MCCGLQRHTFYIFHEKLLYENLLDITNTRTCRHNTFSLAPSNKGLLENLRLTQLVRNKIRKGTLQGKSSEIWFGYLKFRRTQRLKPGTGFPGLEHEYYKILQSISSNYKGGQCPTFPNIDSWLLGNCQYLLESQYLSSCRRHRQRITAKIRREVKISASLRVWYCLIALLIHQQHIKKISLGS